MERLKREAGIIASGRATACATLPPAIGSIFTRTKPKRPCTWGIPYHAAPALQGACNAEGTGGVFQPMGLPGKLRLADATLSG